MNLLPSLHIISYNGGKVALRACFLCTAFTSRHENSRAIYVYLRAFTALFTSSEGGDGALHSLRESRVDMDGVPNHGIGRFGIHDIDVHVDELGGVGREDRSPEKAVRFIVCDDLDKALRLADLVRLAVVDHVESRDLHRPPGLPRLR